MTLDWQHYLLSLTRSPTAPWPISLSFPLRLFLFAISGVGLDSGGKRRAAAGKATIAFTKSEHSATQYCPHNSFVSSHTRCGPIN